MAFSKETKYTNNYGNDEPGSPYIKFVKFTNQDPIVL